MNRIISHRANLNGINSAKYGENHPLSIIEAVQLGFDVEIDIRYINGKFYLGHDKPDFETSVEFLSKNHFWIHCKNIEALFELLPIGVPHLFFHDNDDCVLTSSNYIWSFPRNNVLLTEKSIAVLPELVPNWEGLEKVFGVCTDFPEKYTRY